jgi:peptidoglycan/LPS O-acetylase OafA/YrhL
MSSRLAYLDAIKILLVTGVIAMHTAITYGLDGSWYLESYDAMSGAVGDFVTALLGVGWLFGLGLFFLIAGRLTAPSLGRKGPSRFMKERLVRLGIPLAAYTLLVSPALEYVSYRENDHGTEAFWPFAREQVWQFAPGPAWFLEALLVFTLGYTLLRVLRRGARQPVWRRLRGMEVAAVALSIAAAAFAVHLVFPVGSEQLHLQLAMFPQYVILFSLGAAAGRRGWLETLSPSLRRGCGLAGALAALAFPAVLWAGGFFEGGAAEDRFAGGLHWQAVAGALLEGVLATCVSLWAVGHFSRHEERYFRPLARRMAPASYGAFIVHPPVLVGLAFAAQPLPVPAELKFVLVLVAGVAGSFGLAALARRGVLDHRGKALPDADAHRRQAVAGAPPPQLVGQRADQACAGAAERVA